MTGARLGGVINCAGVGTAGKIIDATGEPHSMDLWDFTIAVNLTGSFNLTRLVLQHLVKVEPEDGEDGERGVVVFVSSAAAVRPLLLHLYPPLPDLALSSRPNPDRPRTPRPKVHCDP